MVIMIDQTLIGKYEIKLTWFTAVIIRAEGFPNAIVSATDQPFCALVISVAVPLPQTAFAGGIAAIIATKASLDICIFIRIFQISDFRS